MPEATVRAVKDHGVVPTDSIRGRCAEAESVLRDLTAAGVDYDDVVDTLERDGIDTFEESWSKLSDRLRERLAEKPTPSGATRG